MGGLVVAASAALHHPSVDRIVLSGALLQIGGSTAQKIQLMAANLLSFVVPKLGLSVGLDSELISRDPEVVRRYREDPYVKDRITARFASGMTKMVARMASAAGRVERPVLIMHGAQDQLSQPQGSVGFHAGLAPPVASTSLLKLYPGLRHEIFNEPEREQVWQDMLAWLDT